LVWNGILPGTNKEVYDAELYALLQAVKRFGKRKTTGQNFTVFTDAQGALDRCRNGHVGPGQALTKAIIRWSQVIRDLDVALGPRAHRCLRQRDGRNTGKAAARSEWVGRNDHLVATISLTRLRRKITERTRQEVKERIDLRIGKRQEYLPPRKPGLRGHLQRERKAVAARFYQLLTGHALVAPFMNDKLKKIDSDQCWWCESGRRQTREHLFKECSAWKTQINNLWRQARRKLGWKRPKMIKVLSYPIGSHIGD